MCAPRQGVFSQSHLLFKEARRDLDWMMLNGYFLNAWLVDFLNLIPEGRDKNFLAHIFTSKTVIK